MSDLKAFMDSIKETYLDDEDIKDIQSGEFKITKENVLREINNLRKAVEKNPNLVMDKEGYITFKED